MEQISGNLFLTGRFILGPVTPEILLEGWREASVDELKERLEYVRENFRIKVYYKAECGSGPLYNPIVLALDRIRPYFEVADIIL